MEEELHVVKEIAEEPAKDEHPKLPLASRDIIILVSTFVMSLSIMLAEMALFPAISFLAQEDGFSGYSYSTLQWVFSGFMLAGSVAEPVSGYLGDRVGKKIIMVILMGVFTIALFGTSRCSSLPELIAFRVLQGSSQGLFNLSFGIIRDTFPPNHVDGAVGIVSSGFSIGSALGLVVGGWISENHGWRTCFTIAWPLMLIITVSVYVFFNDFRFLPLKFLRLKAFYEPIEERKFIYDAWVENVRDVETPPLDIAGLFLLCSGVLSLLLAFTQSTTWGWSGEDSWMTYSLLVVSIFIIAYFYCYERVCAHPLLPPSILSNGPLMTINAATLFSGVIMFTVFSTLSTYLSMPTFEPYYGHGLISAFKVGLNFLPGSFSQLIGAVVFGMIMSKKYRGDVLLSFAMVLLGLFTFVQVFWHRTQTAILISQFLIGFPMSGSMVCSMTSVVLYADQSIFSTAAAIAALFRTVGGAIGPVLAASLMGPYTNEMFGIELIEEKGFQISWGVGAVIGIISGLLLALLLFIRHTKEQKQKETAVEKSA
eukprot:gnl/Dysnectes_brevis/2032_a2345_2004.p1 GENE.gnl/Dysnectes_brevis/2032_a2345_2004~~gnl/Dysnectes_brevis/2032_a2345_2004.p1  ORF type:complete len:570 (-),score=182.42 gnl/Dysnectes_brevis/2032_a2345_2004:117-1730(-)